MTRKKEGSPDNIGAPFNSTYRLSVISKPLADSAGSDNQDDDGDDQDCANYNYQPKQVGRNDRCRRTCSLLITVTVGVTAGLVLMTVTVGVTTGTVAVAVVEVGSGPVLKSADGPRPGRSAAVRSDFPPILRVVLQCGCRYIRINRCGVAVAMMANQLAAGLPKHRQCEVIASSTSNCRPGEGGIDRQF